MKPTNDSCLPGSCDYWMVSDAARKLGSQASTLGARHIKDGTLRLQFNREVAYYAKSIVNDVAQGKKSPEQGLAELQKEQYSLLKQSAEVALKGVGFIAGALQFATGAGICYGTGGLACPIAGVPMMAHGANNMYENGRNLWESRADTQGPVRKGYQEAAKLMGGGAAEGNIAYGTVDLATSLYSAGRMVLKPDSWRLFRYVRTDYLRGYQSSGKFSLITDSVSGTTTLKSMYQEAQGRDK